MDPARKTSKNKKQRPQRKHKQVGGEYFHFASHSSTEPVAGGAHATISQTIWYKWCRVLVGSPAWLVASLIGGKGGDIWAMLVIFLTLLIKLDQMKTSCAPLDSKDIFPGGLASYKVPRLTSL